MFELKVERRWIYKLPLLEPEVDSRLAELRALLGEKKEMRLHRLHGKRHWSRWGSCQRLKRSLLEKSAAKRMVRIRQGEWDAEERRWSLSPLLSIPAGLENLHTRVSANQFRLPGFQPGNAGANPVALAISIHRRPHRLTAQDSVLSTQESGCNSRCGCHLHPALMHVRLPNGCSISHFRLTDRDDLLANLEDGSVQVWTLLIPYPYTTEDADAWLAIAVPDSTNGDGGLNWAIRDESGRQIGGIGFVSGSGKQSHAAEVGYWLAKSWQGRGIMTEAVTAICDHAFHKLGFSRITAGIFVGNTGSARVLEKAGFILEAPLLRKCYRKDGRFIDAMLYAKVRED